MKWIYETHCGIQTSVGKCTQVDRVEHPEGLENRKETKPVRPEPHRELKYVPSPVDRLRAVELVATNALGR